MKRWMRVVLFTAVVASLAVVSRTAGAAEHMDGALGFHRVDAPIGIRWWFSGQKMAIDLGVGFSSANAKGSTGIDESLTSFTVEAGVPIAIKTWDQVHVNFRPGVGYRTQDVITSIGPPVVKDKFNSFQVSGEIEAEVFIAPNVSLSASHGIRFVSEKLDVSGPAGESDTLFETTGDNFTFLGFHVYLFGSGGGQ